MEAKIVTGQRRAVLFATFSLLAFVAVPSAAATFTVNSAADDADAALGNGLCATHSGVCTLRAAIAEANATPGLDTIGFAINSGPQRITVGSALPELTDPVTIDGTTQPGYTNNPIITLYGGNLTATGLFISGGNSTIRHLVINGFVGYGVRIVGSGANTVERSYIGTDMAGTSPVPNLGSGIVVDQSPNNVIRYNLVSSNLGDIGTGDSGGIVLQGPASSGNLILSNLIGTDITGLRRLGNLGRGIAVHDAPNNIFQGNVISANFGSGFRIYGGSSTGNLVEGNYIGIALDRTLRGLGNFAGVQIRSDNNIVRNNLIGGNEDSGVLIWDGSASGNLVYGNIIAFNSQYGVAVFAGVGNLIVGNAIYSNRLPGIELSEFVGIDPTGVNPHNNLFGDGTDTNDAGDLDAGPNNRQNYPVINSATYVDGRTVMHVSLNTVPNATVFVDFFASPSCDTSGLGEGQYPLGYFTVTTDAGGNADFAVSAGGDLRPYALTATTINPNGGSSEFSRCQTVQ